MRLSGSSRPILRRSTRILRARQISSAMSVDVTEPNSDPVGPAFTSKLSTVLRSTSAMSSACSALRASWRPRSSSRLRSSAMRPGVASSASRRGSRKLRAYPRATSTTSPRSPTLSTSLRRMICIVSAPSRNAAPLLGREHQARGRTRPRQRLSAAFARARVVPGAACSRARSRRGLLEGASVRHVGQQRHLAGALDRDRHLALVAPARARDAPRADLALLRDVAPQLVVVLVVDFLDLLAAEVAVLAPRAAEAARAARLPALAVAFSRCCHQLSLEGNV